MRRSVTFSCSTSRYFLPSSLHKKLPRGKKYFQIALRHGIRVFFFTFFVSLRKSFRLLIEITLPTVSNWGLLITKNSLLFFPIFHPLNRSGVIQLWFVFSLQSFLIILAFVQHTDSKNKALIFLLIVIMRFSFTGLK